MENLNTLPNKNHNILITGISGFLGQYLLNSFSSANIIGVYFKNRVAVKNGIAVKLDLSVAESVSSIFSNYKIDYVIHAAASTDLDFCEENEDSSLLLNYIITKNIIDNCFRHGTKLIYLSTDAVFSGDKVSYNENDVPDPISVYGRHKYLSEKAISSTLSNYMICRLSKLFGSGYGNILGKIVDEIKKNGDIILYNDIYRNPISGLAASYIISKLMKNGHGVYHIGGPQKISWLEFGKYVFGCLGISPGVIKEVSFHNRSRDKVRPRKLFLINNRLIEFGLSMPSLENQIVDTIKFHKLI